MKAVCQQYSDSSAMSLPPFPFSHLHDRHASAHAADLHRRAAVLVRRAWRGVGLSGGDGAVQPGAGSDEADGAGAESLRGRCRHDPLCAGGLLSRGTLSGRLRCFHPFRLSRRQVELPIATYKIILGLVLLFAAWRLAFKQSAHAPAKQKPIVLAPALALGAGIGLLSGLTGVGGGIFLSPLLLLSGLGGCAQDGRGLGGIHPGELRGRAAWPLESVKSLPGTRSLVGPGGPDRRVLWGRIGQPPAYAADHAADAGGSAGGGGREDAPDLKFWSCGSSALNRSRYIAALETPLTLTSRGIGRHCLAPG